MSVSDGHEPTLDELLSDPMMQLMLDYDRTTADEVRALMRDVHERVAKTSAANDNTLREGAQYPPSNSRLRRVFTPWRDGPKQ